MKLTITTLFAAALFLSSSPVFAAGSQESAEQAVAQGNLYMASGEQDKALAAFEEAIAADQQNMEASYYLGLIMFDRGDNAKTASFLAPVLKAEPGNHAAQLLYGIALFRLGQYGEAIETLRIADDIKPGAQSRLYLGMSYLKKGDIDRGRMYVEKAVGMNPALRNSADYATAIALLAKGESSDAESLLRGIAASPDQTAPLVIASSELLNKVREYQGSRNVSALLSVGMLYDSNVLLWPGNVPLPGGVSGMASPRFQINGNVDYTPVMIDGYGLDLKYRMYEGINTSSGLGEYDFHVQEVGAGFKLEKGPYSFVLPYRFTYTFYSTHYYGYSWAHSVTPAFTVAQGKNAAFRVEYDYRFENFFDDPISPWDNRTGSNQQLALAEFYRPVRKVLLGFEYRYEFNDPRASEGPAWRYQAQHAVLSGNFDPVSWLTIGVNLEYIYRDFSSIYSNPVVQATGQTQGQHPRIDNMFNASADLVFHVYSDWLDIVADYTFMMDRSNVPDNLVNYNRQLVGAFVQMHY